MPYAFMHPMARGAGRIQLCYECPTLPCSLNQEGIKTERARPVNLAKAIAESQGRELGGGFSTAHLWMFIKLLDFWEPGIVEMIQKCVGVRRITATENITMSLSEQVFLSTVRSRMLFKCRQDATRSPGVGPQPSILSWKLQSCCGPKKGTTVAKCVVPVVRCMSSPRFTLKVLMAISYIVLFIDLADVIIDLIYVARLSRQGEHGYATLLGIAVMVALPLEFLLKIMLHSLAMQNKASLDGLGPNPTKDAIQELQSRAELYVIFLALSELIIFLVEDSTTIFAWWQTGTFAPDETASMINLYLTIISAMLAAIGLAWPLCGKIYEWASKKFCVDPYFFCRLCRCQVGQRTRRCSNRCRGIPNDPRQSTRTTRWDSGARWEWRDIVYIALWIAIEA